MIGREAVVIAGGYDGSIRINTRLDHKGFTKGIDSIGNSLKKLAGLVGVAFGVAAIVNFSKEGIKAASALSDAWLGLQSIVEGQGRSFNKAKSFINDYISDGLVPLENAVTSYKNLAARGYSTEQIEQTMVALKDAAAFGRQASYSLGDAVSTATEGLKNENSILVDNAGVTKNVAKMWDDYAKSIGTTANNLTQEQKIQAEVNGILEETKFQTGDAAKLTNTYSGQLAMLSFNFQQLKVAVGNALIPIAKAVLPGINAIISALVKLANVFAKVTSLLFGKSMKGVADTEKDIASSGGAAADATDKLTESTAGMGDAAEKTGKQMRGVFADFDDLTILADNAADSLSGAADNMDMGSPDLEIPELDEGGELFEDVEISPQLVAEIEAFREAVGRIWEVFRESWEKNGPAVMEAAQRLLSSIYNLLKAIGTAFTEAFTGGGGLEFLDSVYGLLATILNLIADINNAFAVAWDTEGTELIESLLFMFTEINNLLISIGESFREAWNSGVGVEICETILNILTDINNITGTLAVKMREAWEANGNGVAIWTAILNIVESLLSFVERLTASTLEWAQGLNLEPLVTSFRNLLEAIEPLVNIILDGLAFAYENVLLPLAKWAAEELAPVALELLAEAANVLTSVLEALAPLGTWLWEKFLQPLAAWTGDIVIKALEKVVELLTKFSSWITENESLVRDIVIVIGSFAAAWGLVNTAIGTWNNVSKIASTAADLLGKAISLLTSPMGLVTVAIGAIIAIVLLLITHWDELKEAFGDSLQPIIDVVNSIKEKVQEWFEMMKEGWENYIKPVLQSVIDKFNEVVKEHIAPLIEQVVKLIGNVGDVLKIFWDTVLAPFISFIGGALKDFWNTVLEPLITYIVGSVGPQIALILGTIGTVFNATIVFVSGLITGFLQILNGLLEFLNGVFTLDFEKVFKGIQDIVEGAIKLASSAVDGFFALISGGIDIIKDFLGLSKRAAEVDTSNIQKGYSYQKSSSNRGRMAAISAVSAYMPSDLPRLANGAVIPPNQQFAAILGDQTKGYNIEAPADLIAQKVAEGIQAAGGVGSAGPITVNLVADGKILAKVVVPAINNMTRAAGKPVLLT